MLAVLEIIRVAGKSSRCRPVSRAREWSRCVTPTPSVNKFITLNLVLSFLFLVLMTPSLAGLVQYNSVVSWYHYTEEYTKVQQSAQSMHTAQWADAQVVGEAVTLQRSRLYFLGFLINFSLFTFPIKYEPCSHLTNEWNTNTYHYIGSEWGWK